MATPEERFAIEALKALAVECAGQRDDEILWSTAETKRELAFQDALRELHEKIDRFTIALFEKPDSKYFGYHESHLQPV